MVATVFFTFTAQPVYEASALVMIREEGRMQQQIFEVSSFIKQETMINNQVEILKSRTLAEDVIQRLLESPYADSLTVLGKSPNGEKNSLKEWAFSIFKGNKEEMDGPTLDDLVKGFREGVISVAPKRDTDMIELKVLAHSPFEASFVANVWMEAYRDLDIRESRGEISEVRSFLEEKLKDVQAELSASEEALKEYKETQNVAELGAETEQLIKQMADFETMYQEAKTGLEANEKRLAYLKSQLNESQKALVASSMSSPVILELQKQLALIIGEKAAYEQQLKGTDFYSEKDPKLLGLEQRIEGLQNKIVEETQKMVSSGVASMNPMETSAALITSIVEIETENTSLKSKTRELLKIVESYNREMNRLPEKSLKLARLQREARVNNNIFIMIREKYEENRIVEAGQIGSVRIVDSAKPPKEPIKPKKKMNLILGFLVGLGLGVGLTFAREYMDASLKSIEDVERVGFSVMGSIPFITPEKSERQINEINGEVSRIESRLITHFAPKSPVSEAYRTLRTNVQFSKIDHPIKTVLLTSSGPGEGKSTSVANLAITFAQMGTNTLLVDSDLRRPVLHGIFGVDREPGLTNFLVGKTPLNKTVQKMNVDGLSLITSGILPPNPSEMLGSQSMGQFIQQVSERFDIILFDSPPVIAVTDAAVLGTKLDGIVMVVKSGVTNRDALMRSRILLDNVNAHIFGVLVNGVHVDQMYGSYYYYYHYYYYGDGKHKRKRAKKMVVR
jgi:tyrosine-protein kinase Etk/Wzc